MPSEPTRGLVLTIIKQLVERGLTPGEIGDIVGKDRHAVYYLTKKHGWKKKEKV